MILYGPDSGHQFTFTQNLLHPKLLAGERYQLGSVDSCAVHITVVKLLSALRLAVADLALSRFVVSIRRYTCYSKKEAAVIKS